MGAFWQVPHTGTEEQRAQSRISRCRADEPAALGGHLLGGPCESLVRRSSLEQGLSAVRGMLERQGLTGADQDAVADRVQRSSASC